MKQNEALNILKLGYNVFLTGAAGSGKTYVLNQFIEHLRQHNIGVGITASTGIAATHLGGMTIHSWAGIGIRDDIDTAYLEVLAAKGPLIKRFEETKVLIIDEVSMLHGQRLDMVDQVCRRFKNPEKPFGGLQVVLCGDLYQLPPITRNREQPDWIHLSTAWTEMDLKVCYLQEQHRQDDSELLNILNAIRSGEVEEEHERLLNERLEASADDNPDQAVTKLYTHNLDVDRINQEAIDAIDRDVQTYEVEAIKGSKKLVEGLLASCLAPEVLSLKLGAEVMFVANNPAERYSNGTRGQVVGFTSEDNWPVVVTVEGRTIIAKPFSWRLVDGDRVRAEISQIPLRLAWAITVHKSQGMSLDAAEIDLSRAFEPGMGYVALSRVRNLQGLYLKGANQYALAVHPDIQELDRQLQSLSARLVQGLAQLSEDQLSHSHKRVLVALAPELPDELDYDEALFENLREWRSAQARELSRPAYMVFDDSTLKRIAARQPLNPQELLTIKGIGPQKQEQFGEDVIRVVVGVTSQRAPDAEAPGSQRKRP